MRPLSECPSDVLSRTEGVLADIDDTLTTDGQLKATAYAALEALRDAGLLVIPITGRPAGWCDHIARMWPVDAVVGENGAFAFRYDAAERRMHRLYVDDAETRRDKRRRLTVIRDAVLAEVPGAAVAADQAFRETDLAIDFSEDVARLPDSDIARIVDIFARHGATAKISSIHVNGWFGAYDKLTMTLRLMAEAFAVDDDRLAERYVFVGDSPNDAPMFVFFANAVGVANVRDFEAQLAHRPTWITGARSGAGFVELAEALLAVR
ncbi:MAG: HAD-IIB family hydrolase [Methyloligellaceae bacterium]